MNITGGRGKGVDFLFEDDIMFCFFCHFWNKISPKQESLFYEKGSVIEKIVLNKSTSSQIIPNKGYNFCEKCPPPPRHQLINQTHLDT